MSRDIPFFEMFTELQLSGELRLKLAGAVLTGARIDQAAMTMELHLLGKLPLTEEDLQGLREAIRAVYGLADVRIEADCPAAAPASSPVSRPSGGSGASAAPSSG